MKFLTSSCPLIAVLCVALNQASAVPVTDTSCAAGSNGCTAIAHAMCNTTASKCYCTNGYVEGVTAKETCVKVLGSGCTGSAACPGLEHSVCKTDKCACADDYGEKNDVCTQKVSCTGADPCPGIANSVCSSNKCKCKDGYKVSVNVCEKVFGSNCTGNTACTGDQNSLCKNNKCACANGYEEKNDVCTQTVSSKTCTDSGKECDTVQHAECDVTAKTCKCSAGFVMKVDVCATENAATKMRIEAAALLLFVLAILQVDLTG